MALTKAEMAEHLFEELGLNKREAKEMVEMFFEEIRMSLENGRQVKLSGFGNFDLREKKQRPGRNPKPAKRSRSRHAGSSPSAPGRNLRHE
jgi:integration host factor subunit alpha